jgi:curved DNA-binding protein CbpA
LSASFKNHYKTLEIAPQASLSEVKKAYRYLARKYHPDVNANTAQATVYFQEIQSAYEILSNPIKRRSYDNELKHAGQSFFNLKDNGLNNSEQILKQSKDLYQYIRSLDQRVVNNDALIDFVLGLLNAENMALLQRADNKDYNVQIAENLLNACKEVVSSRLFEQLAEKLFLLHPDNDSAMYQRIILELSSRQKKERESRLVPYAAFLVVFIVIVLMLLIVF